MFLEFLIGQSGHNFTCQRNVLYFHSVIEIKAHALKEEDIALLLFPAPCFSKVLQTVLSHKATVSHCITGFEQENKPKGNPHSKPSMKTMLTISLPNENAEHHIHHIQCIVFTYNTLRVQRYSHF